MSTRVMSDAWDCMELKSATATHVMVALGNEADDDGTNCFPGVKRIARRARVSERTVIRTIQELERDGWLKVIERRHGKGARNIFELNAERLAEGAARQRAAERAEKRDKASPFNKKKKVTLTRGKGDTGAGKGDIGGTPLYVLPVLPVENLHPLTPSQPRGGGKETEIEHAVSQVVSALGIANRRMRKLLGDVVSLEMEKGEPAPTVALAMIAAGRRKAECAHLLLPCSWRRFFGDGLWLDEKRWFWDKAALREQWERSGRM